MPKGRLFLEGGGDVTVLGHATCQILPCSATLLLARLLLAPWRSPRDICLPSLLYIPLFLLLSLVFSLDSNPQASLQRHLCEPSQYDNLASTQTVIDKGLNIPGQDIPDINSEPGETPPLIVKLFFFKPIVKI